MSGKETLVTTTFEKFKGTRPGNYCTLPTIDVEIVNPDAYCRVCNGAMVYVPNPPLSGRYEHVTEPEPGTCRFGTPASRCHYCGTNEAGVAVSHQRAWSNEIDCARCGGRWGYGIGD